VDAESECSNCNSARTLKTVTPFAKRCRLRSFECPKCSSVFMIVAFGRRFEEAEKAIDRALAQKTVRRLVPLPRRWD
jgi:hypothetical protein